MIKCNNCDQTIKGKQIIYQTFNARADGDLLANNYIFCSKECLNEWKWDKYYHKVNIET